MNGVTFGEKHTWRDFGLVMNSRPEISPPAPKTVYIEIPASDGKLDLTESLTGDVKYQNRTITCTFTVVGNRERWADCYSTLQAAMHGKRMRIVMDDDPDYFYIGRVQINAWKSSKRTAEIVVEADVEPYKCDMQSAVEDWEWDTFDFETGVIREWASLVVDGSLEVLIIGSSKKVVPTFTASAAMVISYLGETYDLPAGTHRIFNLVIGDGESTMTFTGNGTVSIDYRGGRL